MSGLINNPEPGDKLISDQPSTLRPHPLSVVIATLGGDTLKGTIEAINRGSIVPEEILVCIPVRESPKVQKLGFGNVRILVTECRGQVAQRAIGFQNAAHAVVMQMDDDILLDARCIERLIDSLNKAGPKAAVAPSFLSATTGKSVYKKADKNKTVQAIYYWFMNGSRGYQPGRIDLSGSAVGVDPATVNDDLIEVEFLAGGCVMHLRENLVLENFWPLKGKAYYEDIVHSHLLTSKGIRLFVDAKALCTLELFYYSSFGWREFFRNLLADYRARKFYMQRCARSSPRMYLYYLATSLSYIFKRLAGWFA